MILDEFLIKLGAVADTSGFKTFGKSLAGVTGLVAVATAAIGGALVGINRFVDGALSELDALNNVAERTGESLSFIQELGYAAQFNGSSIEASTRSIESLSQVIGEAANGLGRGAVVFEKLGLKAKNADGSVKSVGEVLGEVQDKIRGLSAQQQQSILSKLGIDATMLQTLRLSREELNGLFQEAHDLGVITAEGADAAAGYKDAMDRMRVVVGALRTNIAVGLAPAFTGMIEKSKEWLIANKDQIRNGIGRLVTVLVSVGGALWNFIRAVNQVVEKTIGWKGALIAVGAALAIAFAANPVTWLIAGIVALVALVDDLMTYMDGGESQFGPFWAVLIDYATEAKAVMDDLMPAINGVGIVLAGLAIGNAASGFGSLLAVGMKLVMFLTGPLVKAVQVAAMVFRAAFMSNPIGLIIALVALLAYVIYENFDKIKEWVGAAWDWCKKKADEFLGKFGLSLDDVVAVAKIAWGVIKDYFVVVFDNIMAVVETAVDWFQTVFGVIGDIISGNFSGAFEKVMAFWDRTVGRISQGVERVKGFFRSIGKSLGMVGDEVNDVANQVNGQVQAAQISGAQAAANAATPAGANASVKSHQDVKIDIHTSDPTLAGRQAAADIKRQNQIAMRNSGSAVAF